MRTKYRVVHADCMLDLNAGIRDGTLDLVAVFSNQYHRSGLGRYRGHQWFEILPLAFAAKNDNA